MKSKSTALTVSGKGGAMLPYTFDPNAAKEKMKARGVSERKFPGAPYYFKKGKFWTGSHKKTERVRVEEGSKLIFNLPFAVEVWQTFTDGRPEFSDVVYMADTTKSLPTREAMGQTDKTMWKLGEDGKIMDPWSRVMCIPVRNKGSQEINHYQASSVSGRMALERLINDWLEVYSEHEGELPIVSLNVEELENKRKETYDAPRFKITGWVKADKVDMPGVAGFATEVEPEDDDRDEDDDEAEEKNAKSKSKSRKVAAEDDPDEDWKGKATAKARAKSKARDEDEDEDETEEEEDEKPKAKSKAKSRRDEEDEDDDDKPRTTRRRRQMAVEDDD